MGVGNVKGRGKKRMGEEEGCVWLLNTGGPEMIARAWGLGLDSEALTL